MIASCSCDVMSFDLAMDYEWNSSWPRGVHREARVRTPVLPVSTLKLFSHLPFLLKEIYVLLVANKDWERTGTRIDLFEDYTNARYVLLQSWHSLTWLYGPTDACWGKSCLRASMLQIVRKMYAFFFLLLLFESAATTTLPCIPRHVLGKPWVSGPRER